MPLDTSIYGNLKLPQVMSLGDMVNLARGAQAYQQAQQINPLAVQQQQAVTQGAQAEATMKQQAASEQQAVKDFLANPTNYQDEKGNADYSKLQKNVMALAPTTGSAIIQNIANTQNAQTTAKNSFLNLGKSERDIYNTAIGPYAYAGDKNPNNYINAIKFAQRTNPDNKDFMQHGDDLINLINANPTGFINSALEKVRGSQLATEQESNLAEKPEALDVGGKIIQVTKKAQTSTSPASIKQTSTISGKSLTPTVVSSPSGAPTVMGGGGGGGGGVNNVTPSATTTTQQNVEAVTKPFAQQGGNAVPYVQGEPYDAYRTRAGDVAKLIPKASEALNINNADSIPNARYTNEHVLKLLDNPKLDVGKIANAIAEKTGGIGLTADQQEVMKYLEQRIRMESSRSNQDQSSQRTAFGSFGTDKEALRAILYKDQGNLAGQELYQRGLLNHAGDMNNPNFREVNKFNTDYAKLNDPKVAHLIGVIGTKNMENITKTDLQNLKKEFGGMSKADFDALFDKRNKLLELVGK